MKPNSVFFSKVRVALTFPDWAVRRVDRVGAAIDGVATRVWATVLSKRARAMERREAASFIINFSNEKLDINIYD
jgi:hypothetical protein